MIDAAKFPQIAKMEDVQLQSQAIGEFLEWLGDNEMFVGHHVTPDGHLYEKFLPINEGTEALLARYFDIDLNAVERERRAVLAAHNRAVDAGVKVTPGEVPSLEVTDGPKLDVERPR